MHRKEENFLLTSDNVDLTYMRGENKIVSRWRVASTGQLAKQIRSMQSAGPVWRKEK